MDIDKTTVREQRVRDAIFSYELREGIEPEPGYVPGYLEEALKDPRIQVLTMSEEVDKANAKSISTPLQGEIHFSSSVVKDKIEAASSHFAVVQCEDVLDNVVTGEVETTRVVTQPTIYQQNTAFVAITGSRPEFIAKDEGNEEPPNSGPLANFKVIPKMLKRAVDHNGQTIYEKSVIQAEVLIDLGFDVLSEPVSVLWGKVSSLVSLICERNPKCIIFDKGSAAQIEMEFRKMLASVPEVTIYVEHGWQLISGRHQFVHKGAPNIPGEVQTDMTLPYNAALSPLSCYEIWKCSLALYKGPGVMAVLSTFSFLGVTYKLFSEAGYPPRFVLFMVGKTNSYKTALAKVLYTQVETAEHRNHPRRLDSDTRVSMERGLVNSGRDNLTIFDDFSPGEGAKKNKLESDLEALIRSVGDGSTRSRSNANLEDRRGEGVKGAVVLTGELHGKGLSSNLRCLYATIKAELVDTETLTWFQSDDTLYGTLLQHLIFYLSANWEQIVSGIRGTFEEYRSRARRVLNTGRMADTAVTLWTVVDILEAFFTVYCGAERDEAFYGRLKQDLLSVILESERIAYEEDPNITFMRALATMLENHELRIKPERLQETDLQAYDGFEEGDYLFLLPTHPYAKIRKWIMMGGGDFNCDEKTVISGLCRCGYAVPSRNGDGKTTLHARLLIGKDSQKVNFIKIRRTAIAKFSVAEPDFF